MANRYGKATKKKVLYLYAATNPLPRESLQNSRSFPSVPPAALAPPPSVGVVRGVFQDFSVAEGKEGVWVWGREREVW